MDCSFLEIEVVALRVEVRAVLFVALFRDLLGLASDAVPGFFRDVVLLFVALLLTLCAAFVDEIGFSDRSEVGVLSSVVRTGGDLGIMVSQGFYKFSKRILS